MWKTILRKIILSTGLRTFIIKAVESLGTFVRFTIKMHQKHVENSILIDRVGPRLNVKVPFDKEDAATQLAYLKEHFGWDLDHVVSWDISETPIIGNKSITRLCGYIEFKDANQLMLWKLANNPTD